MDEILRDVRIFMVEDNPGNAAIMKHILERRGAKVYFERWGKDLIEHLHQFAPVDLILLDLMLIKGMSGFDVFDEIRALPEFARTPIVAVSAADPATVLPRIHEKGFHGFIEKPIDYDQFPFQVKGILDEARAKPPIPNGETKDTEVNIEDY